MAFLCPNCRKELAVGSQEPGKRVICLHCGAAAILPARPVPLNDTSTRTIVPALHMRFACPQCGTLLEAEAMYASQPVQCGQCSHQFLAPAGLHAPGVHIGNCRLIRALDEGGATGNLFLAHYLPDNREVALKLFRLSSRISMTGAEQQLQIMAKASAIKHPNLVDVLTVGLDSGQVYAVTEHVDAQPLSRLPAGTMLPEDQALSIVKQAARGLAHAADLYQMTHLQLRPSLLLLENSGRLRVCGLGWPAGDVLSSVGRKPVLTNYASPEYLEGGFAMAARRQGGSDYTQTDRQSDIFSLGAILYQLLTGLVPFEVRPGGDPAAASGLCDPREVRAGVSAGCVTLLEKMLARPLEARYRSWQEVLGDIERVLTGSLTGVAPLPPGVSLLRRQSASRTGRRPDGLTAASTQSVPRTATRPPPPPQLAPQNAPISKTVIAVYVLLGGIFLAAVVAAFVMAQGRHATATVPATATTTAPPAAEPPITPLVLTPTPAPPPKSAATPLPPQVAPGTPVPAPLGIPGSPGPDALTHEPTPAPAPPAAGPTQTPPDESTGDRGLRLVDEIAASLAAGDVAAARRQLEAAAADAGLAAAFSGELANVRTQLEITAKIAPWLQASFRKDIGRKIEVEFPTGREELLINGSDGTTIAANKVFASGRLGRTFTVQELALTEKLQRLRLERGPEREFACGWVCLENGQKEKAAASFEAAGGLLGSALARRLAPVPAAPDPQSPTAAAPAATDDRRLPVPAKAALTAAETSIRELFKADYAATAPEERIALARKLLQQARETTDDATSRFVLYSEAAALAAEGGDAELAVHTVHEKATRYRVNAVEDMDALLSGRASAARTAPEAAQNLAEACMAMTEAAMNAADYAQARVLLKHAATAAKAARNEVLAALVKNNQTDLAALLAQHQQIQEAEQHLRTDPAAPDMNLTVGRFHCFVRGNWDKGLPALAKGSDPELRRLATLELQAKPEPADLCAIGTAWEAVAANTPRAQERQLILKRAVAAYEKALPKLSGISRTKVEKAVERVDRQVAENRKPLLLNLGRGARLELAWINPGSFMMGSPPEEPGRSDKELQHRVRISNGFWLGRYEVTQAQWEQLLDVNPSAVKNRKNPVENVTAADCQEFLKRLAARYPGYKFRLPTEAEWEYACRAGTATAYYTGRDELAAKRAAWYRGNTGAGPQPGGQLLPNAWGLFDMLGNVSEWCLDCFSPDYYVSSPCLDPDGPRTGPLRVKRGGSCSSGPESVRSAARGNGPPDKAEPTGGFRICAQPSR